MVWEGTESLKEKRGRAKSDVSEVRSRAGLEPTGTGRTEALDFGFQVSQARGVGLAGH